MERILSRELAGRVGEQVRVAGWLHHQRQLATEPFRIVAAEIPQERATKRLHGN